MALAQWEVASARRVERTPRLLVQSTWYLAPGDPEVSRGTRAIPGAFQAVDGLALPTVMRSACRVSFTRGRP